MFTLRRYTPADREMDTSVVQVPAQKLYEKNGFREVSRDTYQDLEVILYEKQLE